LCFEPTARTGFGLPGIDGPEAAIDGLDTATAGST
jgi:hypothetical protein